MDKITIERETLERAIARNADADHITLGRDSLAASILCGLRECS